MFNQIIGNLENKLSYCAMEKITKLIILLSLLSSSISFSQTNTTRGTDFSFAFPEYYTEELMIILISDDNTCGTIYCDDSVHLFCLSPGVPDSLIIVDNYYRTNPNEIVQNKSIIIESNDSISVHIYSDDILGRGDFALVLPQQSTGNQYIINSYNDNFNGWANKGYIAISSLCDGTEIEFIPTADSYLGTPAGVTQVVQLNWGESYVYYSVDELSGSTINITNSTCTHPVNVLTTSVGANIGDISGTEDNIIANQIPVDYWGTDFIVSTYVSSNLSKVRLMAGTDGTVISINGNYISTIDKGEYMDTSIVGEDILISSNFPISVSQFSFRITSGQPENMDESQVNIMPLGYTGNEFQFYCPWLSIGDNKFVAFICCTQDTSDVYLDGQLVDVDFSVLQNNTDFALGTISLGYLFNSLGFHSLNTDYPVQAYLYFNGLLSGKMMNLGWNANNGGCSVSAINEHRSEGTNFLYPNPAQYKIYVQDIGFLVGSYKIFTSDGKTIMSGEYLQNEGIDIESIPEGVYLIGLYSDSESQFFRFVKEIR